MDVFSSGLFFFWMHFHVLLCERKYGAEVDDVVPVETECVKGGLS